MKALAVWCVLLLANAVVSQEAGSRYLVVKVALDASRDTDRGFLAAAAAAQQRHDAATFDWDGADYDALAAELRLKQPENVLFVTRPEHLDVVRHRRILLLTSKLDDDWFVDCAFGYLTGRDGDACERFWQHIEQRRARTDESRNWTALSVASMDQSMVYRDSLPALAETSGYRGDHYYFGTTDPDRERVVAQALAATDTADVLHFSGNGDPEGIWLFPDQRNLERDKHWPYDPARVGEDPDGVMPRLMAERFAERAWRAPIVWSGTCHSGAVDRVFVEGDIVSTFGRAERVTVHRLPAGHSLALAWLDAGAAALLVPIAANHGMSASMEIDFALQHGASLGEAVKSSWDDVLLQAEGELALDLPVEGEAQRRGGEHVMQGGGANRVLLGDPALRPFAATTNASETVVVERRGERGGIVTVTWAAGWHPHGWDIYGVDRARDWRAVARVDAATLGLEGVADGAALDVQVTATGDGDVELPYTLQRCAIERHAGKVWLHLQANAPRAQVQRKAATVRFAVAPR
ncbi:MAG: hypothetical protein H6835_19470 [Planctomycetes bacterium]|nr:hypothetical protein [Planctomycetota bacterium]